MVKYFRRSSGQRYRASTSYLARVEKVVSSDREGKVRRSGRRRWLCPAAGTLVLGLVACDRSDLPPEYRDVTVPTSTIASADARARGRALFLEHCAICHGVRADGQGLRSNLSVPPADFTDPSWRKRTTERRAYYVVREGIRGTPMPAWKILSEEQTWDLVAYVLSVAELGSASRER